jgi:hypothetical protein
VEVTSEAFTQGAFFGFFLESTLVMAETHGLVFSSNIVLVLVVL